MIGGRHASVLLYAVPGLTAYDPTRRMLINGADGVICLADGQAVRRGENVAAGRILREHLGARDATGSQDIQMVYFYTKQDLPEELLLPADVLGDALGVRDAPVFAGDAVRGVNVREALQAALTLVLRRHAAVGDDTGG
jgi:signal recognition particle receptor subunit beta